MITHCKNGHEYTEKNTRFGKDEKTKFCRTCHNVAQQKWRQENPEKWKATHTKARKKWERKQTVIVGRHWQQELHTIRRYGIDHEQYKNLFAAQNGVCAICFRPETEIDKRTNEIKSLHIDHNHDTKEIRGLLCGKCNKGIGHFEDVAASLKSAICYLENPPARGFFAEQFVERDQSNRHVADDVGHIACETSSSFQ